MEYNPYINDPKTLEDFEQNAQFQLDNVQGWFGIKDYESALIKARCLLEALELIIKHKSDTQVIHS